MKGDIDNLDWIIEKAMKHTDKMPTAIWENRIYYASGDTVWEKDTDGFLLELEAWRNKLREILRDKQ